MKHAASTNQLDKVERALIKNIDSMTQGEIAAICNSIAYKDLESFESGLSSGQAGEVDQFDAFLQAAAPIVADWASHN